MESSCCELSIFISLKKILKEIFEAKFWQLLKESLNVEQGKLSCAFKCSIQLKLKNSTIFMIFFYFLRIFLLIKLINEWNCRTKPL